MELEIDWNEAEEMLNEIVGKKMPIEEGVKYLDEQLYQRTGSYLLQNIDIERLEAEFNEGVRTILNSQPVPSHIKSLYFGMVTISDPVYNKGIDTTIVHFMGSSSMPESDTDWACAGDDSFLPESRYFSFTDFCLLDELIKNNGWDGVMEVLLYNGILSLLVINNIENHRNFLLRTSLFSQDESTRDLYVGCGFDSGDTFILGKITPNGFL
jgi:hypothetical protein